MIYAGAAHAHADEFPGDCRSSLGEKVCIRKEVIHADKRGRHVSKETQDCSTVGRSRVVFPEDSLLGGGFRNVGPVLDCSNNAQLPKGVKVPHPKVPHPKF
ncbi:hypothetical protein AQI88_25155 [Streptomyces cellostaticus]|uniref:Uncharacterized protein n=1 Tax=Streptomyces cellostaticus TaxID=67285 RepID=A0A101NJ32_9ACTN|nr:hypothetical protein AQI88_25155 [Streptomyces cellostaticus]